VSTLDIFLLLATDHNGAGGLLAEVHVPCDPVHHNPVRPLNTRQPDIVLGHLTNISTVAANDT